MMRIVYVEIVRVYVMPSNWGGRDKRLLKKRNGKLTKRIMTEGRNSKASSKALTRVQKRKQKDLDEEFYC